MTLAVRKPRNRLIEIHSLDEVPEFANEEEEATYWDTHSFSEELLNSLPAVPDEELDWLPPVREPQNPLSVRFDSDTLARLKALARKKHIGYQTLLKQFVIERLYEEERREGIIPRRRTGSGTK